MIPYADLVTALRNWRERNGLPNFGPDVGGGGGGSATTAPPAPSFAPPAPLQARTAPPAPPPGAASGGLETMDVEEEIDAVELESEAIYDSEGGDFAMGFGGNVTAGQLSTEPGTTSGELASGTYDDDFASEAAPATGGTRPGIAVGKDPETVDDDDDPRRAGKKKR